MNIVKYVLLFALIGLCVWLIIDTTIFVVKRVKEKRAKSKLDSIQTIEVKEDKKD